MTSLHTPLKPISNGPKAALPTRLPPPVQILPSKPSTSAATSCILCHRTLHTHMTVNCCELCRPKQSKRIKLPKQGRVAQTHGPSVYVPIAVNTTESIRKADAPCDADTDVEMTDVTGGRTPSPSGSRTGTVKRKADAMMNSEGPGGEEHPRGDSTSDATLRKEYQTGQDLVDALSEALATSRASRATAASHRPPYVNFHGSYTIVMDPDVRGERRVKQVVDELRHSAKLQCGNIVKRESEKSCSGHARTFWCACDPPFQPPTQHPPYGPGEQASTSTLATPTPSQAGAPPKRRQSTLMGWLAKSQSKEKFDDEVTPLPPPGCGGTITVYAVTDFSHPLGRTGIQGQKIAVQIEHPGRDFKYAPPW